MTFILAAFTPSGLNYTRTGFPHDPNHTVLYDTLVAPLDYIFSFGVMALVVSLFSVASAAEECPT